MATKSVNQTAVAGEGATPAAKKTVKIRLFKDGRNYKDDVFVGINGRTWLIQRGVEVEVPESVAKVLRNSELQDNAAAMRKAELTSAYDAKR